MKRHILSLSFLLCLLGAYSQNSVTNDGEQPLTSTEVFVITEEFVNNFTLLNPSEFREFNEGLAAVKKDGKWGFIDKNGQVAIPIQLDFDEVDIFHEGLAAVEKDGKCGYIDKSGKVVIPIQDYDWWRGYDDHLWHRFLDGMAKVEKNGKWGFINKSGKVVVPILFDWINDYHNGLAAVKKDEKWGSIDKNGKVVIPIQYDYIADFHEGLAAVEKDGKWGFIDNNGKVVVPFQFERKDLNDYYDGVAIVRKNGKWGGIDKSGKVVVPFLYDCILNHRYGLFEVEKDGEWGIVDKSGKVLVPIQYAAIDINGAFREELVVIKKNGKWVGVDKSGNVVVEFPLQYDLVILNFDEGLAAVEKDKKYGFVDMSGKVVVPIQYDFVAYFHNGLAEVYKDGKWGAVDKSGKVVVPIMYDWVLIDEGLIEVKKNGKYGVVDKSGEIVIPIQYDDSPQISDGLVSLEKDGKWCFFIIDKNGKVAGPFQYYGVSMFQNGLIAVEKNGKYGVIDKSGKVVVPNQYDYIVSVVQDGGLYGDRYRGYRNKYGFVDKNGNVVFSIWSDDGYIIEWEFHEGVALVVIRADTDAPCHGFCGWPIGYIDKYGDAILVQQDTDFFQIEGQRIKWSNTLHFNIMLQQAVNDYNALLKQYPYNYDENRITYSLSMDMPDNERFLQDTLHSLLEIISVKKAQLKERYHKDSLQFRQFNDSLQEIIKEANTQLLANPYNLQKRTIDNGLSDSLFGKSEELTKELNSKLSAIPLWKKQIEQEVYTETKKNNPSRFCEIFFTQNPSQIQLADSIYLACRCKYPSRNAFDLAFIDNTLPDCNCREKQYQEVSYLYHSREEFDQSYNQEENTYLQELDMRKKDKRKLLQLEKALGAKKQIKMKKALSSSKQEVLDVVNLVSQHRNGYYYEDAVELILRLDDKFSNEWERNGKYFKSKTEMYEYYIGEDYEKVLKARKKE